MNSKNLLQKGHTQLCAQNCSTILIKECKILDVNCNKCEKRENSNVVVNKETAGGGPK